jgi:hypothetical protein
MKKREGEKPILINSDNIAVQSNRFIEARYKESLTFWESFLITKMCSMIAPDDVDFKPYKIYIKEVIDFMGLPPGGNVYAYIYWERTKTRKILTLITRKIPLSINGIFRYLNILLCILKYI